MFETLDTMIALAVVYLILSMINKFILSGGKRLFKIRFRVAVGEFKAFASSEIFTYLQDKKTNPEFITDYTKRLKDKKLTYKNSVHTINELNGSIEIFLKKKNIHDIASYLNIDLTGTSEEIAGAKARVRMARDRLETAFNSALEQITTRYTMWMRYIAIGTGLIIAVAMNADFFVIYKSITENSTIRTELLARAEGISERIKILDDGINAINATKEEKEKVEEIFKSTNKNISELTNKLSESGLRLGWEHEPWSGYKKGNGAEEEGEWSEGGRLRWFFNKLVGLLASGFLIGFGAPFWHDLLTSLVGIKKTLRGKSEPVRL